MDFGKVSSLLDLFSVPFSKVDSLISEAYGDDPAGNDKALLDSAKKGFVVACAKNISTGFNLNRVHW